MAAYGNSYDWMNADLWAAAVSGRTSPYSRTTIGHRLRYERNH
jgi:hypothetical protein